MASAVGHCVVGHSVDLTARRSARRLVSIRPVAVRTAAATESLRRLGACRHRRKLAQSMALPTPCFPAGGGRAIDATSDRLGASRPAHSTGTTGYTCPPHGLRGLRRGHIRGGGGVFVVPAGYPETVTAAVAGASAVDSLATRGARLAVPLRHQLPPFIRLLVARRPEFVECAATGGATLGPRPRHPPAVCGRGVGRDRLAAHGGAVCHRVRVVAPVPALRSAATAQRQGCGTGRHVLDLHHGCRARQRHQQPGGHAGGAGETERAGVCAADHSRCHAARAGAAGRARFLARLRLQRDAQHAVRCAGVWRV
eukprot:ctg_350.g198